jgi:anti-repressor protein
MGTLNMNQAAKILGIGRNKLFRILRDIGILEHDNTPYQEFIDRGYFEVTGKQIYPSYSYRRRTKPVTLVTHKGLHFLHKMLLAHGYDVKPEILDAA